MDTVELQLQVRSDGKDWAAFGQIYTDADAAKKQLAVLRGYVKEFKASQRRNVQYRLTMRRVSPWCEVAE